MTSSRKTVGAALAALTLGTTLIASAAPAEAGWYGHRRHYGGAVAAGVLGALAVGAIAAGPAYASSCYWTRRSFVDGYGDVYVRRVRVCD